jgi:SGNH hydrolase-like domain, acetyltransferase AlgX
LREAVVDQVQVELEPSFGEHGRGDLRGIPAGERLTLQGWVIGREATPIGVELSYGTGKRLADVAIDQSRPDVAAAFPDAPGVPDCGFRAVLRAEGSGRLRIRISVRFDDGPTAPMASLDFDVDGDPDAEPTLTAVATDRESEKVMFGQEGWLYLRRDSNDILAQHTGQLRFEPAQLAEWGEVLRGRMQQSERLGAVWSCAVAPDKESVYPEYLPEKIVPVERRPVHEFLDLAAAVGAPVVYPLDRLLEAKRDGEVYPRIDTHWNYRGAYIGYRALCESVRDRGLDLEMLQEDAIEWVEREAKGDLGSKVRPDPVVGTTIAPTLKNPSGRLVSDNEVFNHGRVACFEQAGTGLRCVVFGESFTPFMLPFLKETFQRLVFVHTSMFVPEILEQERPDVVLSLPTERFLIRVPEDGNAIAELRATALRKGGELPWTALT